MPQSQPTANPRYQEEEKKNKNQYVQNMLFFFFCCFFQHIKMSKAFTLEKSQKKKKKSFLFMACTPVYFIVYGICGTSLQFIQKSNPTLQAQPLLYATGKMSLNWGLDCSSMCSMHAPVVNCLPSFGRAIGWTVKYEWGKSIQVIMSFF